jgi:predicted PurR-regulated permease PerM
MNALAKESPDTRVGANQFLLFVILLAVVLYFGRALLIPLVTASFFAMLMAPVCRGLEKKIKRPFAVIICILLLLIVILGILAIVIGEINSFMDDVASIEKKANGMIKALEASIQNEFGVQPERQIEIVKKQMQSFGQSAGSYLERLLGGVTGILGGLVISLVYTFLLLFHRERYETFFIKLFGKNDPEKTKEIIEKVTLVGQHYLKGRVISILILCVIYAGGFLIVGLKSAILLGAIAALLSIIPYVGGLIGGIFPFLMSQTMEDSTGTGVGVVVVIILAHALSSYIIEPLVVGGQLRLSALSMILFIIVGSALWGIAGMILFVPVLAMVKILCDNIENLKPYGYLIADPDEGKPSMITLWFSRFGNAIIPGRKRIANRAS